MEENNKVGIDELLGQKVKRIKVSQNNIFDTPRNELMVDEVLIYLDNKIIVLRPITETDEIEVLVKDQQVENFELSNVEILPQFVNSKLSYTWECFNTNNYFDTFMMAFDNLKPNVAILCDGNVLKILLLEELPNSVSNLES